MKWADLLGYVLGLSVIGHDSEHRLWHNKGIVNRASCLDDQALRCHFAQKLTLAESWPM